MKISELKYDLGKAEEISRDLVIIENEILKTHVEEERDMLRRSYSSLLEQLRKINESLPDLISGKDKV